MRHNVFDSRFTYRADYVLRKSRKSRCVFLTGEIPVTIREVDAAEARVAYRIISLGAGHREEIQIRSFDGSLWWPVTWQSNPVEASHLLTWIARYWDAASTLLDPMRRTYYLPGPSADEFFEKLSIRSDRFVSTRKDQSKSAERDASRVIFCEGRVLVDAGDPVWYATLHEPSGTYDLFIGHSNLDRPNVDGYVTPGPDRDVRLTCARLGRAYGLREVETGVKSLGAQDKIRYRTEIVATSDHAAASAADLCVRALAQHLWEIAWRYPDLRKAMPAVANARHPHPPPEALPHRQMLEQLVSFQDPGLRRSLSSLISDAHRILERLSLSECPPFTDQEDAALAQLADWPV